MACCFSSNRRAMTPINFFPEQRDLGSFSYSKNVIFVSDKKMQDMEICNKVENEDSIHFGMKTLLSIYVHVGGTCPFIFLRSVAMCIVR